MNLCSGGRFGSPNVYLVLDILLNFRTTFVNAKGEVVTNSKDIATNYLKTWFFLDLVAALPFDFLDLFELNLMVNIQKYLQIY